MPATIKFVIGDQGPSRLAVGLPRRFETRPASKDLFIRQFSPTLFRSRLGFEASAGASDLVPDR